MASAPLKAALTGFGYDIIPDDNILVAITGVLFLLVIKKIHFVLAYTDEVIPFYLSLLGLTLATAGVLLFTRLMLLGGLCLMAAAYWNNGILKSYSR